MTSFQYFDMEQVGDVTELRLANPAYLDVSRYEELRDDLVGFVEEQRPRRLLVDSPAVSYCDRVGPVRVVVETDKATSLSDGQSEHATPEANSVSGKLLFVCSVIVAESAVHKVRVLTLDGQTIAATKVIANDVRFHTWVPFKRVDELPDLVEAPADQPDDLAVERAANRISGRALPAWNPMRPLMVDGKVDGRTVKIARDKSLPSVAPSDPHPSWELSTTSPTSEHPRLLTIKSKEHFVVARADWHFLARWWVNGEPFIVPPLKEGLQDANGQMVIGRHLELHLTFDDKGLGAESGDRVGGATALPAARLELGPGHREAHSRTK